MRNVWLGLLAAAVLITGAVVHRVITEDVLVPVPLSVLLVTGAICWVGALTFLAVDQLDHRIQYRGRRHADQVIGDLAKVSAG